jgi:predicted kinase
MEGKQVNELYVIRGLPGSGKSTLARKIALAVCEADQFFMVNGVYQFDKDRLTEAHEWCQRICKGHMEARAFTIAVANTFVRRWTMEPYYRMAFMNNYRVTEITMSGTLYESVHGVPVETIQRMSIQWEK